MSKKKKPTTHVAIILDRSGSMCSIASQAVDHYNEQRTQMVENSKDQNITVSLVTFNGNVFEHEWLEPATKLAEADRGSYIPNGSTAWFDALGYTIKKLKETTTPDDDTAYLVMSISDGEENSSSHYNSRDIRSLIEGCEVTGKWTFSYMGCSNENLKEVAKQTGIPISNMGLWSNSNAEIAANSLNNSTKRTSSYYASRARGMVATANLYSDTVGAAADFTKEEDAKDMLKIFLETKFSGKERHKRRLSDIEKIEANN